MEEKQTTHKRRVRYKGTHPRKFSEKYKGSMNVSVKNEKFVLKIMLNLDEI